MEVSGSTAGKMPLSVTPRDSSVVASRWAKVVCRRRVGVVVGGHVDRLHRGDRPASGRGDPLLELTHLVGQRRLVTHRGRHPAEQGGHLGAGLGVAEDVVDEQQHVLIHLVAEVLRHGQRGQRDAHAGAGRLVHLTEDQRGVLQDAGLLHLQEQVVALTGALADAGEHRGPTEVPGDPDDHLLDEHRLSHSGTTEQTDLAALHVRGEQIDDLQTGLEHLGLALELVEGRRLAMDRPAFSGELRVRGVQAFAQHVENMPLDLLADRYRDRRPGVGDRGAADQPVCRLHRDSAHGVVAEVLRDLQRHRLAQRLQLDLHRQRVEQLRQLVSGELHVHHGARDPHDPSDPGLRRAIDCRLLSCTH